MCLPLCVLIATAITAAWRRSRWWVVGLAALMVVATVPFLVERLDQNHGISEAQVPWRTAHETIPDHSLVIVQRSGPYLLHLDPFSENNADLDGRLLFAIDRGAENLALIAAHPDRTPYFESTDLTLNQTLANPDLPVPTITVSPIVVTSGPSVTVHARVTATHQRQTVAAALRVGTTNAVHVLSTNATRGETFDTEWKLTLAASTAPDDVAVPAPLGTFVVEAGTGHGPDDALRGPRDQLVYDYGSQPSAQPTSLEVLTPGESFRVKHVGHGLRPRRATRLRELEVSVSPTS